MKSEREGGNLAYTNHVMSPFLRGLDMEDTEPKLELFFRCLPVDAEPTDSFFSRGLLLTQALQ